MPNQGVAKIRALFAAIPISPVRATAVWRRSDAIPERQSPTDRQWGADRSAISEGFSGPVVPAWDQARCSGETVFTQPRLMESWNSNSTLGLITLRAGNWALAAFSGRRGDTLLWYTNRVHQ